jgi:hypothetical protein
LELGEISAAGASRFVLIAVNFGGAMGRVKLVVAWKNSMCPCSPAGMEYWSVRMLVVPVSTWVKMENSVERSSLACATGMTIWSMSPAGVTGVEETPLSDSHPVTTESVSFVGFTNSATY